MLQARSESKDKKTLPTSRCAAQYAFVLAHFLGWIDPRFGGPPCLPLLKATYFASAWVLQHPANPAPYYKDNLYLLNSLLGIVDAWVGIGDGGIQAQEEADSGLLCQGAEKDVHHDKLEREKGYEEKGGKS